MELALGTVQFGSVYGITNTYGKTPQIEVEKILKYAKENGIKLLDTAPSYGDSEKVLGKCDLRDMKVVSKTIPVIKEIIDFHEIDNIEKNFYQTLENLNVSHIYSLIVHQTDDIFKKGFEKLYKLLYGFKEKGFLQKIGFSIYEEKEINHLLKNYDIDMIQIPINIFDQRLIQNRALERLKKKKIEIHARSIFLQGVLLDSNNPLFKRGRAFETSYFKDLRLGGVTPLEGCLQFINELNEIDFSLVGVNKLSQLKEINNAKNRVVKREIPTLDFSKYAIDDIDVLDPRRW